ncbi:MAG TPA: DUF1207 domain-containing protein [Candidatus Eisenbacteria bacterium]|jgi:hypothetical protein
MKSSHGAISLLILGLLGTAPTPPASAAGPPIGAGVYLFRPLLADPREDQFRMNLSHYVEDRRYGTDFTDSTSRGGYERREGTAWDVATGAILRLDPMRRFLGVKGPWIRYQLGVPAGVFTAFDGRRELMNVDYQVGASFDALWSGDYSDSAGIARFDRVVVASRMMVYHRSSHLGDEYLVFGDMGRNQEGQPDQGWLFHHPPVKRVDLSFEAVRGIVSLEWAPRWLLGGRPSARAYAGGEVKWAILPRAPSNFSSPVVQLGVEFRSAGNQDDPDDGLVTRLLNGISRRAFFESEWFAALDWKLAKPYDFASCDSPMGGGETWTPSLWTDCPYGHEFAHYAGSVHAMIGLILYEGSHRRITEGGRRLTPELLLSLEWYGGYSPNGQFLDQRLRTRPLGYWVPGLTIHF